LSCSAYLSCSVDRITGSRESSFQVCYALSLVILKPSGKVCSSFLTTLPHPRVTFLNHVRRARAPRVVRDSAVWALSTLSRVSLPPLCTTMMVSMMTCSDVCLLSSNTKLKPAQLEQIFDRGVPLQVESFKVNVALKAPGWRGLGLARDLIQQAIASYDPAFSSPDSGHNVMPVSCLLMCPRCNHVKNAIRICLYFKGNYNQQRCCNPLCMQSSVSKSWMCPCKLPWPKCIRHGAQGYPVAIEARRRFDFADTLSLLCYLPGGAGGSVRIHIGTL
jgi:hypothetical protein